MGVFEHFPYTNFHDLNLDWILKAFRELENEVTNFVSINAIKYADPLKWDITRQYEKNTVVLDTDGNAFLSVQPVPSGVSLDRTEYWTNIGNFSALWENVKSAIAVPDEGHNTTASAARQPNTLVWVDNKLLEVTSAMNAGDRYNTSEGGNSRLYTMQMLLDALLAETHDRENAVTMLESNLENAVTMLESNLKSEAEQRKAADIEIKDSFTDIINKKFNSIVFVGDFGAKGDGVTDDTQAFRDAIKYCQDNFKTLYVPQTQKTDLHEGGYILSGQIDINRPVNIICDPLALLNWKNVSGNGYGFNIDYSDFGGHKGVYRFGILQGNKSFYYSQAELPSGHFWTAVRIANSDIVDFKAEYICFWNTGIELASTNSETNNIRINFMVMDDCETGIRFNTQNGHNLDAQIIGDTIGITKYGIIFDGTSGSVRDSSITLNAVWVEYPDGCCIGGTTQSWTNETTFTIKTCHNHNTDMTVRKTHSSAPWKGGLVGGCSAYADIKAVDCVFNVGFTTDTVKTVSPLNIGGNSNKAYNINKMLNNETELSETSDIASFNNGESLAGDRVRFKWTSARSFTSGETIDLYAYMSCATPYNANMLIISKVGNYPEIDFTYGIENSQNGLVKITLYIKSDFSSGYSFYFNCALI